jgi:hypothetical protein
LLGLSPFEATFARRGFRGRDPSTRNSLETIGETFLGGYRAALHAGDIAGLEHDLSVYPTELHGFAYEGAAMGLALLDRLTPWRRGRVRDFLAGAGAHHIYMVHVGIGWVWARLKCRFPAHWERLDPLLRWLALDGYGFHEGYFHFPRTIDRRDPPCELSGYARRAYDQGLGRSIWFVEGADVPSLARTLGGFPASRRADLWSGVGLACAYAGGIESDAIAELLERAGAYRADMAQGAAFAAQARRRAGNPAPHTDLACNILCGLPAREAAEVTDEALAGLPPDGNEPSYEVWRRRIRERFTQRVSP